MKLPVPAAKKVFAGSPSAVSNWPNVAGLAPPATTRPVA